MMDVLKEFESAGWDASFHFADDSGKEWKQAYKRKDDAMRLYFAHPEHQEAMKEIAKGFLWNYDFERAIK